MRKKEKYDTSERYGYSELMRERSAVGAGRQVGNDFGPRLVPQPLAAFRALVSSSLREPFAGQSCPASRSGFGLDTLLISDCWTYNIQYGFQKAP